MENRLTGSVGRVLNRAGGPIRQDPALPMAPQMIQGVEVGGGFGQEAHLNAQGLRHLQALFGRMGRAAVCKQHDLPPPLVGPDHRQKVLVGFLHPLIGDQQQHRAAPDIEGAMEHPFAPIARNGDADLLTNPAIAAVPGGRFTHEGFLQPQAHRPLPLPEPAFEPPLAWRQVGERSAK